VKSQNAPSSSTQPLTIHTHWSSQHPSRIAVESFGAVSIGRHPPILRTDIRNRVVLVMAVGAKHHPLISTANVEALERLNLAAFWALAEFV
jgi:hypothetical protein